VNAHVAHMAKHKNMVGASLVGGPAPHLKSGAGWHSPMSFEYGFS